MKKLEEELGVTLFDRQKNKIFLNGTGKIAAEHARHILLDDTESTDQLQRHSDLPGFSTDIGREAGHSVAPNRVHIKISDPAACVTFYLVCDRTTISKWKALFPA